MKNKKTLNGGYIGLIMLLVGVTIIVFLVIRADLFNGQKDKKNMIEQANDYTDQARGAKDMLEKNNPKTMEELE